MSLGRLGSEPSDGRDVERGGFGLALATGVAVLALLVPVANWRRPRRNLHPR